MRFSSTGAPTRTSGVKRSSGKVNPGATPQGILLEWALRQGGGGDSPLQDEGKYPGQLLCYEDCSRRGRMLSSEHMKLLQGVDSGLHFCWDSNKVT